MKTIYEWLQELPDSCRTKALNESPEWTKTENVETLKIALLSAFTWRYSSDGYDYWNSFYNSI